MTEMGASSEIRGVDADGLIRVEPGGSVAISRKDRYPALFAIPAIHDRFAQPTCMICSVCASL
jgi:hypothetical protein